LLFEEGNSHTLERSNREAWLKFRPNITLLDTAQARITICASWDAGEGSLLNTYA
jgi:hypothetical protein